MKLAIKTFVLVVAVATTNSIVIAQTPYDDFAPSSKKKEMLALPNSVYKAFNADTTTTIKYVAFDKDNLTLTYFSKDDSVLNVFALTPKEYKWWSVDPMAHKYPHLTPYDFVGGNPINRVDPNGADWFKDENGNTQWHQATGKVGEQSSLKGLEGTWTNIGTEFIEFNGKQLTYSWQTMDKSGSPMVNSMSFDAVSGKGTDPTGYWNLSRIFDYSSDRQKQANLGPTPEGLYSINKANFVDGQNEGGTQRFGDQSYLRQAASSFGKGTWPGGTSSWGDYRWKLQNEGAQTFGRDNFYLHGGSLWGSRGCIDCGAGISSFYNSFISTNPQNTGKVYLQVKYAEDLKFEIQNKPTTFPMVTPTGQPIR